MRRTPALYQQVAASLRKRILRAPLAPGAYFASEHGLCRALGISRVTMRRCSDVLIEEGLLLRRPGLGLFLRTRAAGCGEADIIACDLSGDGLLGLARAIRRAAKEHGIGGSVLDAAGDTAAYLAALQRQLRQRRRGAIICGPQDPAAAGIIAEAHTDGAPVVLVGCPEPVAAVATISADDHLGGWLAGLAFQRLGHARVMFIGNLALASACAQLSGMRQACSSASPDVMELQVVDVRMAGDASAWTKRISEALRSGPRLQTTAILASSPGLGQAARMAASELGLSIPDRISLLACEGFTIRDAQDASISSIAATLGEVGTAAVDLLARRAARPDGPPERRIVPVHLVDRGTLAPAWSNQRQASRSA